MEARSAFSAWLRQRRWVIVFVALVQFALHLWTNAHDTIFRDEMYYLAAARHLDFGYVDFPPFIALVAGFSRWVLGDSVVAIRLLPALSGVVVVLLTANMAAMLGGGPAAQALAAIVVSGGPFFIGSSGLLTMDPFDQMWWTVAAWVLVRLIKQRQPQLWLLFGLAAGQGLLTKLTMAFFVLALVIGLMLSRSRQLLFSRWLVFGGLIALAITAPYIVWQIQHGLPVLEFTRAYASGKTYQATPFEFLGQQLISMQPLAVPVWLGGLYFLFFVGEGKPYRAFGWAYLFLFVFFMLQHAKFYWLSSAYPPLFAAGAYSLQLILQRRPRLSWLQPVYTGVVAIGCLLTVPLAIPILPAETYIRYNAFLGGVGEAKQENLASSELPQNYADRYGWHEMATAVKQAYEALTPEEQGQTCILARNYGEAAAMDYFGQELGLPRAISGHNSYYIWGPQGCTGRVIISINRPLEDLSGSFESVTPGPAWSCKYCLPHENGAPIVIARGLKVPLEQAWSTIKAFD